MSNSLNLGSGNWATKDNSLLGYNSENGNFKPLPFDFSRGSIATVINKQGLIETVQANNARVDYLDNAKGALLLEPQRTNSLPYSSDFTSFNVASNGTGSNPIITSNYATSPDGTQNADRVQLNRGSGTTSSDTSYITYGLSLGTIDATLSIYLKTNDETTKDVTLRLGASLFDYDVTVTSNWQRFTLSGNTSVDRVQILLYGNQNSQTADISCFAAQVEQGSYPTSLIKTQGTAQTRLADVCNNGGNAQVINSTEGVLYAEYHFDATIDNNGGSDRDIVSIEANSSNKIQIVHYGNGSLSYNKKVYFFVIVGGSYVVNISSPTQSSGLMKVACGYKNNDFVLYVNGVQIGTDTSAAVPTMSKVIIGKNPTLTTTPINQTKLYNTRLSNSELAALTTI